MALLVRPSPPCSLQLGSSRRCRESSSVSLRIRLRPSRFRVFVVYSAQRTTGDGREGQSWIGSRSSPDSFAGWSGSEIDGGGNLPEKGGFGGMLGAGLAGVLFLGGITFATLSLSSKTSRSTSDMGVKQRMTALTTEQELQLTSDDHTAETVQLGNETNAVSSDKESNINDILPNFLEVNEDKHDNFKHLEVRSTQSPYSNGDGTRSMDGYFEEGSVQIHTDVDNNSVSPDSNPFLLELSANYAIHSTNDNCSTEFSSSVFSGRPESVVRHNEILCVDHVDSCLDTVSADYANEQSNPSPNEIVDSDISLSMLTEYKDSPPSKTFTSNQINFEPSDMVESHRSLVETVFVSNGDDREHGSMLHLSDGESLGGVECAEISSVSSSNILFDSDVKKEALTISNYPNNLGDGHKLDDSFSSYDFSSEKETNLSTYNQSNYDSTSESLLPEKSLYFTGVPAPSLVSSALQVPPGKILVPAVVDQVQSQALAALQVLKVIEGNAEPGDLCTRREYARWLVSASSALSRNTSSKMYPAMYIENVTELAFNDVTPEDPDFSCIQGLAEAGIISSRFSLSDMEGSSSQNQDPFFLFFPESPVSRQNLVSWKMALEKRKLPQVDKNHLYQISGYLDIDKIDTAAWPALVADLSSREHGIIPLAFGYTRLFQPNKPVTKAQAAIALATGEAAEIVGEELARIEAESLAETAVSEHAALVAQVEKEINNAFAEELAKERKKMGAVEKLAEEARLELDRMRAEREEENRTLLRGRAAVESEMEILSRLKCEVEEKLHELLSNEAELSFERERINRLKQETESENQSIVQLQYELEVERKALSLARTWAEEEAKRARELARSLEQARERWERHGIKVVVDGDLQEDALVGMTWISAGKQASAEETINSGETLAGKLKTMAAELKLRSSSTIDSVIQRILAIVSSLRQRTSEGRKQVAELGQKVAQGAGRSVETIKESAVGISSNIGERTRRALDDCKESVDKISHKFKA